MYRKKRRIKRTAVIIIIAAVVLVPSPLSMAVKGAGAVLFDTCTGISAQAVLTFSQQGAVDVYMDAADDIITEQFRSENGTVVITDDDDILGKGNTGVYIRKNGVSTVYVRRTWFINDPTVLHEMGHCLDGKDHRYSSTDVFMDIASREISGFSVIGLLVNGSVYEKNSYESTGSFSEYFAEAYCWYKVYPHALKMAAPETYRYFSELLEGENGL